MNVCFIPSNIGLGHIKRSVLVSNYLAKFYKVTIVAEKKKISKFKINKNIKIIDYKLNIKLDEFKKTYNQKWYLDVKKKIRNLKFNLFISDNLPEIVFLSKNSMIISNFFWHELFKMKNPLIKKTLLKIKKNKTVIFRNYIFKNLRFKTKIGFMKKRKKITKKNSILFSFGTATFDKKNILNELNKIVPYNKYKYIIDHDLFKNLKNKKNFIKASYKEQMFKKIEYAIIKPGFGIVQDCLENNIKMIGFTKKMNSEFKLNAKRLEKYKLLKKVNSIDEGIDYINSKKLKNYFNNRNVMWSGEKKIYKTIKNYFI